MKSGEERGVLFPRSYPIYHPQRRIPNVGIETIPGFSRNCIGRIDSPVTRSSGKNTRKRERRLSSWNLLWFNQRDRLATLFSATIQFLHCKIWKRNCRIFRIIIIISFFYLVKSSSSLKNYPKILLITQKLNRLSRKSNLIFVTCMHACFATLRCIVSYISRWSNLIPPH